MTGRAISGFAGLVGTSIVDPRLGLRRLIALFPTREAAFALLGLVAVLTAMALHLLDFAAYDDRGNVILPIGGPISSALIQTGVLMLMAVILHWAGRSRGGQGSLDHAVLGVAWLEAILLLVQLALILLIVLVPILVKPVLLIYVPVLGFLFFWLLTGFVSEIHGFQSRILVFLGVLGVMFGLLVVLSFVIGLIVGPEVLQDV